jgi:hypothetical protein
MDHFHLHCIIPAGVLSFDKTEWVAARDKYLFRVESLAKEFRKRYLSKLEKLYGQEKLCFHGRASDFADKQVFNKLIKTLKDKEWITYSKQPLEVSLRSLSDGPEQVFEYLGRYTHRVAITNNRIVSIEDGKVTFSYCDRSDESKIKELTLKAEEFIRRFLLHILPGGFMKIRYYGFLAHANKKASIPLLRQLINPDAEVAEKIIETVEEMMLRLTGTDLSVCPECGKGKMTHIEDLPNLLLDTS